MQLELFVDTLAKYLDSPQNIVGAAATVLGRGNLGYLAFHAADHLKVPVRYVRETLTGEIEVLENEWVVNAAGDRAVYLYERDVDLARLCVCLCAAGFDLTDSCVMVTGVTGPAISEPQYDLICM